MAASKELMDLVERLNSSDTAIRNRARQGLASMPRDTIIEWVASTTPQGNTRRMRYVWRLLYYIPGTFPIKLPRPHDTLLCALAEQTNDPRLLSPMLTVLWDYMQGSRWLRQAGHSSITLFALTPLLKLLLRSYFSNTKRFVELYPSVHSSLASGVSRLLVMAERETLLSLSPKAKKGLLILLWRPYQDVNRTLRLLHVLAQVGDENTIPTLQWLLKTDIGTANSRRIQAEAQSCLESIQARINERKQGATLLRSADIVPGDNDLLRPQTELLPPEQLLRSAPDAHQE